MRVLNSKHLFLGDTLKWEEMGVNKSVIIGLHDEVLEMMETELPSDSAVSTLLPCRQG